MVVNGGVIFQVVFKINFNDLDIEILKKIQGVYFKNWKIKKQVI